MSQKSSFNVIPALQPEACDLNVIHDLQFEACALRPEGDS